MNTIHHLSQYALQELKDSYSEHEIECICRIVYMDVLHYTNIDIHLRKNEILDESFINKFIGIVRLLKSGSPIQYILGETGFAGLRFKSTPSALIPRPETEELVRWVGEWLKPGNRLLDVGSGSGCIGISLARLCQGAHVTGVDISPEAIELARENALLVLSKDKERLKREEGRTIGAVKEIEALLDLDKIVRMEAYDISNTNGFESVGSMVVYERGRPKRNDYRKFKIRGIQGADDYGSMREVLTRRFTHGLKEREENVELGKFTSFPYLIMMDGGKGQVNVALQVLDELHLHIPVCGMVKDDHHRTRGLYYQNEEIPIDRSSEAFRLITRIQDEAHRFAIEYHRQLRGKGQVHSILDDIEGIGPARRKALMRHYMSLDDIRKAKIEELAQIPSMNEKAAESVYKFFH